MRKKTIKPSVLLSQKDREDEQKLEDGIARSFIGTFNVIFCVYLESTTDLYCRILLIAS